jgi:putative transposase
VLEFFFTERRDRRAALAFLTKAMKRYGPPKVIVTDRLRSYRAAMGQLGNASRQVTGRWLNNPGENSYLPFRRREYSMQRFRREKTLQKFVSVHSEVCNHFNNERYLISRDGFTEKREAALVEWPRLSTA